MNKLIIGGKEVELSPESWKAMEKQFNKESFYPEIGDTFYYISADSEDESSEELLFVDVYKKKHEVLFDLGLAFKTDEESEEKLAEMQAIAKVRKFIFENDLSFEPDYRDFEQRKYSPYYDFEDEGFDVLVNNASPEYSPFGHLKSEEDCEKVIEGCSEELKIIFKVKK